jgi:hypothetical protein
VGDGEEQVGEALAVDERGCSTKLKSPNVCYLVAFGGKDVAPQSGQRPSLTLTGLE